MPPRVAVPLGGVCKIEESYQEVTMAARKVNLG